MYYSNVIHRKICVKDFLGTTAHRILKFGTNIVYDLLYCVKENQHAPAYHSLYLSIFSFSPSKFSATNFSSSMRARVFKFCIHIESGHIYCGTENKTAEIYFAFFFLFPISHSSVIYIGKFVTNISQELLHIEFCNWYKCCESFAVLCERQSESSYLIFP